MKAEAGHYPTPLLLSRNALKLIPTVVDSESNQIDSGDNWRIIQAIKNQHAHLSIRIRPGAVPICRATSRYSHVIVAAGSAESNADSDRRALPPSGIRKMHTPYGPPLCEPTFDSLRVVIDLLRIVICPVLSTLVLVSGLVRILPLRRLLSICTNVSDRRLVYRPSPPSLQMSQVSLRAYSWRALAIFFANNSRRARTMVR